MAVELFGWLCLATGTLVLFAGILWALGLAAVKVMELLKVWNTLRLVVAVQLHGSNYRDRLFWQAVSERASKSRFEADNIIRVVERSAPTGEPTL